MNHYFTANYKRQKRYDFRKSCHYIRRRSLEHKFERHALRVCSRERNQVLVHRSGPEPQRGSRFGRKGTRPARGSRRSREKGGIFPADLARFERARAHGIQGGELGPARDRRGQARPARVCLDAT